MNIVFGQTAVYVGAPTLNVEWGEDTDADGSIDTWHPVTGLTDTTNILRAAGVITFDDPGTGWQSWDNGSLVARMWVRVYVTVATGITMLIRFSIFVSSSPCSLVINVNAFPRAPIRAVRPIRCTYTSGSSGQST